MVMSRESVDGETYLCVVVPGPRTCQAPAVPQITLWTTPPFRQPQGGHSVPACDSRRLDGLGLALGTPSLCGVDMLVRNVSLRLCFPISLCPRV